MSGFYGFCVGMERMGSGVADGSQLSCGSFGASGFIGHD